MRRLFALVSVAGGLSIGCASDLMGGVPPGTDASSEPSPDAAPVAPTENCEPPDLMVILDRTGSMSKRPNGTMPPNSPAGAEETKWHLAVSTIEAITAKHDDTVSFGLTLFPHDPDGAGGKDCSNLGTWLEEWLPPESNDLSCQPAEMLVSPAVGSASAIDSAIDTMGTGLCSSTPIGAGLAAAESELDKVASSRDQYALLITDGDDNCDGDDGYTTNSFAHADSLFTAGRKLFVLGFDGTGEGIDAEHLNQLACAGGTAPSFDTNCVQSGGGYRAVENPEPARLFKLADSGEALDAILTEITEEICCGCTLVD